MSAFLVRAKQLLLNGYRVVPVRHNSKRVTEDAWQESAFTQDDFATFAKTGYSNGNVGILTESTPAVDLDIYDATVAAKMEQEVLRIVGDAPVRVGQAPKRLLVCRTEAPFRKLWCTYADQDGDKHKVEILGAGQQFVAYGVHPDTKREYDWTSFNDLLDTPARELPLLTAELAQEVLDAFERVALDAGWTRIGRSGESREIGDEGGDDALDRFKPVLALSLETVKDTLDDIPNDEADYDDWLMVGCALHHQFGGGEDGLQLWHEWGEHATKYSATLTNKKWGSFGHGPDTATFATLLYRAKKVRQEREEKEFEAALNRMLQINDRKTLLDTLLPKLAAAATSDLQQDIACKKMQDRLGEIDGTKPRLETIRKMFLAARPKLDLVKREAPKWCEGWVYVASDGIFYNTNNGARLTPRNFDAVHGRELLDDVKRSAGEAFAGKASDFALNLYEIPQVYAMVYLPGESTFLTINRRNFVNTYDESSVPESKKPTSRDDFDAVKKIERHFEILFPDERERLIFIDYLAYNVQFPNEKISWGCLIQGVDGGGKTFLFDMMAACIGGENARSIPGKALQQTNTAWAEGRKMVFVEEVRLHNDNKFEILDNIRPYVTNQTASIRRMATDYYDVPNVTNYVFFTNYLDAIPINRNDRRYFILRTWFQTASHINQFNADNPGYFADLYAILSFNSDVLRWWFLNHEISEDFKPKGHAPATDAKNMMREASESDEDITTLEEILEESEDPEVSYQVLNLRKLRELGGMDGLGSRAMGMTLARAGFALITKARLRGRHHPNDTFYTRHSELFPHSSPEDIRRVLALPEKDDGFDD